ncbi:hypothetical protein [Aminiphilus circumscriptus]|uniref:hypothetical protein n=1 Tax=Aminiphilus circumscriptus TaxID=290732 RepID=UPI0004785946|nr:hypothetical protein [Aminiphilus circumscriptus]
MSPKIAAGVKRAEDGGNHSFPLPEVRETGSLQDIFSFHPAVNIFRNVCSELPQDFISFPLRFSTRNLSRIRQTQPRLCAEPQRKKRRLTWTRQKRRRRGLLSEGNAKLFHPPAALFRGAAPSKMREKKREKKLIIDDLNNPFLCFPSIFPSAAKYA